MTGPVYTWTGTIQFTGTIDPTSTNTATMTLTPGAGETNLPAVINGTPGLPPVYRNITVNQVNYGDAVPASTAALVDPGGPGTASTYDLTLYVTKGQNGTAGTNASITAAGDIENNSSMSTKGGWTIYYNTATSKWTVSQPKMVYGPYICLPGSFNANYASNAGAYTVATIGVPALPYAYRPVVDAQLVVGGTANTQVDLLVRKDNATTGDIVAYGIGPTGPGPWPVTAGVGFGSAIAGASTYGQVAANTAATFFLVAKQNNATTDNWTTTNTNGRFSILALPSS